MALVTLAVQGQDLRIHVNKKGKVGFADSNGNVVIDCKFESAYPFSNGVAIVCKSKNFGMIDTSGKIVLPIKYSSITHWNDLYLIKDGKKVGLADKYGSVILKAEYSFISKTNSFGKGIIAMGGKSTAVDKKNYMMGAKYGIIDSDGKVLISPQYKGLYEFAFAGKDNYPYYEGKRLLFSYHFITDTLLTDYSYLGFSKNSFNIYKSGVIDGNGKELVKQGLYTYIMYPKNNMVRYYIEKKKETICGYHDLLTGKSIQVKDFKTPMTKMNYWSHGDFIGDIAPVNGDSWSFIDKSGRTLRQGYFSIKHSEETGLWAAKNSSAQWDVFDELNNDLGTLSGYEEIYFPTQKDDYQLFTVKKAGKYGAITRSGNIVIPFEYDMALGNKYDVIAVMKNGKWGALSVDNKPLFPIEYANFILPSEKDSRHFWVQQSDSLYYHLNLNNHKISGNGFKSVHNFNNGVAFVVPDGITIPQNTINKALLYAPNTPYDIIYGTKSTTVNKKKSKLTKSVTKQDDLKNSFEKTTFGFLINTDDLLLLSKPISILYKDAAIEEIKGYGNRALSDMETKSVLLKITQGNRVYGLKETLDEEEWNY